MSEAADPRIPRRIAFDPTFNVGHLMTIAVIIMGVVGSVVTLKDGLREGLSEIRSENRVQDQRIDTMAKEQLRTQQEDATFRSEVRQSLTQLSGAIADLRVTIATGSKEQPGRR